MSGYGDATIGRKDVRPAFRPPSGPVDLLRVLHDQVSDYGSGNPRIAERALEYIFETMYMDVAETGNVDWTDVIAKLAQLAARVCTRNIKVADAFWIKDGMLDAVRDAMGRVAAEGSLQARLKSSLMVCDNGFLWFEKPYWGAPEPDVPIVATSWHAVSGVPSLAAGPDGEYTAEGDILYGPGFIMVSWTTQDYWTSELAQHVFPKTTKARLADIARHGPQLMPVQMSGVPFDAILEDIRNQTDEFRLKSWTEMGPIFLAGMWALMNDVLVVDAKRQGIPSNVRRRYAKKLRHPHVRVITLRKVREVGAEERAASVHREWTHRWIVDEFWRHLPGESGCRGASAIPAEDQEHCERCGGRVTRVVSHVKGPQGLDLQVKERVYNLSR